MANGFVVNARYQGRQVTGVERYAGEILRRLPAEVRPVAPGRSARGPAGHAWEQLVLPARVGDGRLWSPANSGPLAVKRQAVTIHDLAVLEHPEWFRPGFALWYRVLIPRLALRARRVIAVSENARGRIVHRLGVDPHKVQVISGGVDPGRFHPLGQDQLETARRRLGLPEAYVLCVASRDPRKNLGRLLAAWRAVSAEFPRIELLLAGGSGPAFAAPGLDPAPRCRALGYVSDEDLAALYAGALALVYPSLDEGFGLPVLEAMACGAPVIATCAGAVPEAAGDAAEFIDPLRVESILLGLRRVLADRNLRQDLRERGLTRAAQFTWEASAAAVCRVMEAL